MKSWALAAFAAATTSSMLAPRRPYSMFDAIVPENSSGSCSTTLICARSDASLSVRMSMPSTRIRPSWGS